MSYFVLEGTRYSSGDYSIIPIREGDKFSIMQWRNEQLEILRQTEVLTAEKQTEYFERIVKPQFGLHQPAQILFSYLLRDELIGYGGLVHIKWIDRRAEVSFLLKTERNVSAENFKKDYKVYLKLIKKVAFEGLKFNKLTTEAFDLRPYLIETLEENGFVLEGRLKKHNLINDKFVDSLLHSCFA
jgi:RimJ/RimL family protein N-acetyltransferase